VRHSGGILALDQEVSKLPLLTEPNGSNSPSSTSRNEIPEGARSMSTSSSGGVDDNRDRAGCEGSKISSAVKPTCQGDAKRLIAGSSSPGDLVGHIAQALIAWSRG